MLVGIVDDNVFIVADFAFINIGKISCFRSFSASLLLDPRFAFADESSQPW